MERWQVMEDEGASMVEYAFLLAGIALAASVAFPFFATKISDLFGRPLPFFGP